MKPQKYALLHRSLSIRCVRASTKVAHGRSRGFWGNIEVEDVHRNTESSAGIWNVNYPSDDAFDRSTGQEQIDLLSRVP